tara:strand:+ start:3715 stop:3867 length:153 start_codon:yes stop_codon:yes gene_type:complete
MVSWKETQQLGGGWDYAAAFAFQQGVTVKVKVHFYYFNTFLLTAFFSHWQ